MPRGKQPKPKPSAKPKAKAGKRRASTRILEQHYEVKHIALKVYDEDAVLFEKLVALSNITSLCTFVFQYYYYHYQTLVGKSTLKKKPEGLERPLQECALIDIPLELELAAKAMASASSLAWDDYLVRSITAYILKVSPKALQKRRLWVKRKNNSALRWKKHFLIRGVNFNLYNDDALHAAELDNLTGFTNVFTNYMRSYYHTVAQFYAHNTTGFIPSKLLTPHASNLTLVKLQPEIWDAYVSHAQAQFKVSGQRASAEDWMLYAIKDSMNPYIQ